MNIQIVQSINRISPKPLSNVTFRGEYKPDEFSSDFKLRRNRIMNNLLHQPIIDKKGLKKLSDAPTQELFDGLLFGYVQNLTDKAEFGHIDRCEQVFLDIINRKGKSKLSEEQFFSKSTIDTYDKLAGLYKAVIEPDKDKDILIIKDILRDKYDVKEMYFNNDVMSAKNWLETAKLVSQYGLELPKRIITCPYVFAPGTNAVTSKGSLVVINPDKAVYSGIESTKHPLHTYVHETVHCNQLSLVSFSLMNIPERFKETADNISDYAKSNFMHEVHAELKTKQILSDLSPEEKELLCYIEND